jgi:hypothetical protein
MTDTSRRATGMNYTTWRDTGTIDTSWTVPVQSIQVLATSHDRYKAELVDTSWIGELPVSSIQVGEQRVRFIQLGEIPVRSIQVGRYRYNR